MSESNLEATPTHAGAALTREASRARIPLWVCLPLVAIFIVAILARSLAVEMATYRRTWATLGTLTLAGSLSLAALAYAKVHWRTTIERIGNRGLALIALVSAMHFAVSFASVVLGIALSAALGPYASFVSGIGDEAIPCALLATTLVLLPRRGVLALSAASVFTLNVLATGSLGLTASVFIVVSCALQEIVAAIFGLTSGKAAVPSSTRDALRFAATVGLALGLSNSAALGLQFAVWSVLYRMFLSKTYIATVIIVTGFVYGALGGFAGALFGLRQRRVAA